MSPVQVPVNDEEQVAVDATVFADDVSLYQTDCDAGQKVMRIVLYVHWHAHCLTLQSAVRS